MGGACLAREALGRGSVVWEGLLGDELIAASCGAGCDDFFAEDAFIVTFIAEHLVATAEVGFSVISATCAESCDGVDGCPCL